MVQQRPRREESPPTGGDGDTRRRRQMRRREADIEREVGERRGGHGLENLKHPLLLLAGGWAAWTGIKRFGKLSSLFWMGLGGGLIYRVLDENELLDGRLKQRLLQTAASGTTHLHTAITVDLPVQQVYAGWRSLENLAESMRHIESVEPVDDAPGRWRFRARIPRVEMAVEWEAEIVEDRQNEHLSWRSTDEADIEHEGAVEFRPRPDGESTEIHVDILYHPPAGGVGQSIGRFLRGLTERTLKQDVRRFKQYLETGVVATIEGQTSGRQTSKLEQTGRRSRPTVH